VLRRHILLNSPMKFCSLLLLLTSCATAGEYALLSSGMRLRIDRHERTGDAFILYSGAGSMKMAAAEVSGFEAEEYVPPPKLVATSSQTVATAAPVLPAPVDPKALVDAAARKTAIPQRLLRSVVAAESAYRADAVSPKGAIGLMQLMPATAAQYGADPMDPAQNVEAGTAYLRDLLLKYNGDVASALAAYNAGPGAVDRYHGIPPYAETRSYVGRIIRNWQNTPRPEPVE
jgi:soluble lytic murein transglycosylase-like protein